MRIFLLILLLTAFSSFVRAQDPSTPAENVRKTERIVTNAPFSAEAVSESVQLLTDGNRIARRSVSKLYRDSEGRYRREDMPKQLGLPGAVIDMPESIVILDPVAGYKFQLNTKKNTARRSEFKATQGFGLNSDFKLKMELFDKDLKQLKQGIPDNGEFAAKRAQLIEKRAEMQAKRAEGQAERTEKAAERSQKMEEMTERAAQMKEEGEKHPKANTTTESLGVQNIEGVEAEGTRTTTTIPAGSIGNERDIQVVYEKWYSKDLQMTVYSKNVDPRFGEQTYRLTNINRSDPPMTLFAPPADYQIVEDGRFPAKPAVHALPKVPPVGQKPPPPPKPAVEGKKP